MKTCAPQSLADLLTAESQVCSGDGWRAGKFGFEAMESIEFKHYSNTSHVLYCASEGRPSSGMLWQLRNSDGFEKCPRYFLLPVHQSTVIRFDSGEHRGLVLEFDPALLSNVIEESVVTPIVCGLNAMTHQHLQIAIDELSAHRDDVIDIEEDLLRSVLIIVARLQTIPPSSGISIDPSEAVEAVAAHIRNSLCTGVPPLDNISELAGLSERHLQRKFREEMDMSPQDYLAKYRIEVAKEMLSNPEIALKTIAYELGYANPSHFTRSFKAAVGLAPSAYAKQMTQ